MKKIFAIILALSVFFCFFIFTGCTSKENKDEKTNSEDTLETDDEDSTIESTDNEASADSDEKDTNSESSDNKTNNDVSSAGNPIVTIKVKNYGEIVLELYPDKAPQTVENFIKLANEGMLLIKLQHLLFNLTAEKFPFRHQQFKLNRSQLNNLNLEIYLL